MQESFRKKDAIQISGTSLKQKRRALGWTQADLAGAIGISRGHVSNLERTNSRVGRSTGERLAATFNVSVDELGRSLENTENTANENTTVIVDFSDVNREIHALREELRQLNTLLTQRLPLLSERPRGEALRPNEV